MNYKRILSISCLTLVLVLLNGCASVKSTRDIIGTGNTADCNEEPMRHKKIDGCGD